MIRNNKKMTADRENIMLNVEFKACTPCRPTERAGRPPWQGGQIFTMILCIKPIHLFQH
jgi:hypothetical protein